MAIRDFRYLFEVPAPARLLPMEGLRGFAVALVFGVHYSTFIQPWIDDTAALAIAHAVHRIGNTGVDLFFVLSGFLIYGSALKRHQSFLAFMQRRVERLYPAFLVVLSAYLLLSLAVPSGKFPDGLMAKASYIAANILLLPGIFDIDPIVSVAWSLSYELFFYLSVPALIGLLALRKWKPYQRIALCFALVLAALIFHFPWPRMMMFAAGMVLSELMAAKTISGRWLNTAAILALAGFWLVLFQPALAGSFAYACDFVASLLLFLAALADDGFVHRFFCNRPLRWLGNMSYSYYLAHGLGIHAFFLVFKYIMPPSGDDGWLFFVLIAPAFLASLTFSISLYLLIERPFSILPSLAKAPATVAAAP